MNRILLAALISLLAVPAVFSGSDMKQFEQFWVDSYEILDNLDEYSAFWIKPHGCV